MAHDLFPEPDLLQFPSCLFLAIWFPKWMKSMCMSCSSSLWNVANKSVWTTTKGFHRALWENEDACSAESWEEATASPVKPAATFFPSAFRSHALNCISIVSTSTGGHGGIEPTHQHSLGIRSIQVHTGHTPALHSWGSKHTGHLDYTHRLPHHFHHSGMLEEEKEGYKMLIDEISTFICWFCFLISIAPHVSLKSEKKWKNKNISINT